MIVLASLLGAVVAAMLAGVSCQDTSHEHRLQLVQTHGVVFGLSLMQPLSLNHLECWLSICCHCILTDAAILTGSCDVDTRRLHPALGILRI